MNAVEKRKQIKRNNVLKVIRASDEVSRFVIKKVTKYSMTTILNIVDSLIKEDLITEEMSQDVKIGRTPIYLNINPKGQYFIGIEFNADVLKSVAIDFNVDVIYSEKFKMDKGMSVEQIITLIKTAVNKALEQVPYREKVAGIGIGVPGYVDKKNGIALEYSYFNDWNNVEIKKIIEEEFAIDVYIDNNINALTYHYKWVNPKEKDFIVVSMQYGTRLGIVLNNDIFIGSRGNAGEIGHTKVRNGNRLCSCGKIGCLDSEISYLAIQNKVDELIKAGKLDFQKIYKKGNGNKDKFMLEMLRDEIKKGNEAAIDLLKNITAHLGMKLSTVISVLNIKNIIILNVYDLDNENFAKYVYETIKENSLETLTRDITVSCEIVDKFAAAKGAAIMVLEDMYGATKEKN